MLRAVKKVSMLALSAILAPGSVLLTSTAVVAAPPVALRAVAPSGSPAGDVPTTSDPSISVSIGNLASVSDPSEPAGLPSAESWKDGITTKFNPRPNAAEPCAHQVVYSLQNLKNPLRVDFSDSFTNKLNSRYHWKLTAQKSTQFKWNVSVKVGTSADVLLFGKLSAEVNAGIERTKSTTYGSEVDGYVEPHKTVNGDRGMFTELSGFKETTTFSNCQQQIVTGKVDAPYRENWNLEYA